VLPVHTFAEKYPWEPYSSYLPYDTPVVKRQLRGTWISTVVNLDWPSVETRNIKNDEERIRKSKEELIAILDKAVEMNLNAVFFQVSPEGDAFYKSDIVPWSRYLTGTFGKDPGFDPLEFAIEEAHKRNLELHAWFNPYRVTSSMSDAVIASLNIAKSVYYQHPEWIKTAMNRFVVDPGIPEARQWVIGRVMEVVNKYDVDGVHFDDYFYYEATVGELKDDSTYNTYNQGQFSNKWDWRRNNTYLLVSELSQRIRASKPWVKFGISPSGIWGNKKDGLPDGSNTNSSFTNYGSCFADTKKWVEDELIDYIAPQIYFSFGNTNAPYGELASWWSDVVRGKNVHLYIGQALYKINDDTDVYFTGDNALPEFSRQLKFNATKDEIQGSILFRVKNLYDAGKQSVVNDIKNNLWATKALIPVMPWKGGSAPQNPIQGRMEVLDGGIRLTWLDNDPNTAYYAVYRFNKGENIDITSDASALKLIATVRKNNSGTQEYMDTQIGSLNYQGTTVKPENVVYIVTALDRLHNESSGLTISLSHSVYFSDVGDEYAWAVKAIDRLYELDIIKGVGQGIFNPGQNTKRGDFILMLVRALNLQADITDNFADVPIDSYYHDAIGIAKALGIAKGSGYSFNPEGNITREDMMVIIARSLASLGIITDNAGEEYWKNYNDADLISSYAREAVANLTKAGLVQGSDGGINPKGLARRAEIAVILHRILEKTGAI